MKENEIAAMPRAEKFEKMCKDFPLLTEENQDYILGILQALVFASNTSPNESRQGRPLADDSSSPAGR